jgi:hypothetical protein
VQSLVLLPPSILPGPERVSVNEAHLNQ